MVDEKEILKQYSYKATSNLVLQQNRGPRRNKDVATGEVEPLKADQLLGRMGDKADRRGTKPSELLAQQEKRRQRAEKTQNARRDAPELANDVALHRLQPGVNVVDVADELELDAGRMAYVPSTEVTQKAFEALLAFVTSKLGDQPRDLLRSAAYETLLRLKDQRLSEMERKKVIEDELLAVKMSPDEFSRLSLLGRQITDFGEEAEEQGAGKGARNEGDDVDGANAVPILFDEDNDEENAAEESDGAYEVYDDILEYQKDVVEDDLQTAIQQSGVHTEQAGGSVDIDIDVDLGAEGNGAKSEKESSFSLHQVDGYWLQRQLSKYYEDAHQSQKVAEEVLEILASDEDDGLCENRLVRLLDRDKYSFISLVVENREGIVFGVQYARAKSPEEKKAIEDKMAASEKGRELLLSVEAGFTATSVKDEKKASGSGKKKEKSLEAKSDSIKKAGSSSVKKRKFPLRMLDLEALSFQRGTLIAPVRGLPTGSEHVQGKDYEEWHIPAVRSVKNPDQPLVPISSLPEWSRVTFPDTQHLNRMQSAVYPCAFQSDENMLLCAPTGAGKTNVAVLTILRAINNSSFKGSDLTDIEDADLSSFKVVYVAPMKALVAEVVLNLGKRFESLGISVRELTGDVNLSRHEIEDTNVIVTTPEKWDIITRKSDGKSFTNLVRLLIVDEIHLLHDERGPVLESIIARTLRRATSVSPMVRIVGLSATLPNYKDVATFLRVNLDSGLFHFDASYRPCPLQQCYIGISTRKALKRYQLMNELTFEKVKQQLQSSNQAIVFVHSRKETLSTCRYMIEKGLEDEVIDLFLKPGTDSSEIIQSEMPGVNSKELANVLQYGLATHHAGMSRSDRNLVESLFEAGHVKVLVSTATLAWGVNLPAHAVIIKGTQVYSPEHGRWVELSSLDVMQMLGRAGRPQFGEKGEGIIITTKTDALYYLSLLNEQLPIESQFVSRLVDMLNAEVAMGSVSSIDEGSVWLSYTYLYVRMLRAHALYTITVDEHQADPKLERRRAELVHTAASVLHRSNLVKYDKASGSVVGTELGRVAADFYVSHQTMSSYAEHMKSTITDIDLLRVFSLSGEFRHMKVREEEKLELARLAERVPIPIKESLDEPTAKVNVLLQAYISRLPLDGLALKADMMYVTQSAARLARALLQIAVRMKSASLVDRCLRLSKNVSARQWISQSPLRQFGRSLGRDVLHKIERKDLSFERYYDLTVAEVGELLRDPKLGRTVHRLIHSLPRIELEANVRPLSRSTVEVELKLSPDFRFDDRFHGSGEVFWILIEDGDSEQLLHSELFFLRRSLSSDTHFLTCHVPLVIPNPPCYFVKCTSDRWIVPETVQPISFRGLLLPEKGAPYTKLLDMRPLSVKDGFSDENNQQDGEIVDPLAYREAQMELIEYFVRKSRHFTPLETQLFNCMYRTSANTLVASVPNEERITCAELCIARLFATNPTAIAVWVVTKGEAGVHYIQQTLADGIGKQLNLSVGTFLSNRAADMNSLKVSGSLVVTTCERWDMLSRRWKMKRERRILERIGLIVVDGVHAVGDRGGHGATTEVLCSRMRYIAADFAADGKEAARIVALSDPVANARELGHWLGVPPSALFSMYPHEVDAKLKVHVESSSRSSWSKGVDATDVVRHVHRAVRRYLRGKEETIAVFVPNRRIARFAAMDLANSIIDQEGEGQLYSSWKKPSLSQLEEITLEPLRACLASGVGYLFTGMPEKDRLFIETFTKSKVVPIMIISADYVWKHNVPSSALTVVAGTCTEEQGGFAIRRAEYSHTDLMKMLYGRASSGSNKSRHAVVITDPALQGQYKLRLENPLPVESQLPHSLSDHLNAEIVAGVIETKQDAVDYLTWTFFYRRLPGNPNYYGMTSLSQTDVSKHLSEVVDNALSELVASKCVATEGDDDIAVGALNLGIIASHYYVRHATVELFASSITTKTRVRGLLHILSMASEFEDLPVRIEEEDALKRLSSVVPVPLDGDGAPSYSSPDVKVHLLLQAHLSRHKLSPQLAHDQATILPTAARLLRAMVDVISSAGWLKPALAAVDLCQMIVQAVWDLSLPLLQLPHVGMKLVSTLRDEYDVSDIFEFTEMDGKQRSEVLRGMSDQQVLDIASCCRRIPDLQKIEVLSVEQTYDEEDEQRVVKITVQLQRQDDSEPDEAVSKEAPMSGSKSVPTVAASRFPEVREEGWWVIVGDEKSNSLLTLKHVALKQTATVKLEFLAPNVTGEHELQLYLRSDSYLDCDQDDSFKITVRDEMPAP